MRRLILQSVIVLILVVLTGFAVASQTENQQSAREGESHNKALDNSAGQDSQQELQELLSILKEETKIATKTKMNSDYVPGMVTVLHGEHLEALGVRTVAEALTLVPGIQLSRIASGEPTVKVRGVSFPFNAGNIQVLLNSIALSRESSGVNSSVLLTPVEQIEKIEVIRGPGSIIYGDFAMAGVVNIFTRNSGGRLYSRGGDDQSLSGGGHYSYRDDERSMGLGLNVSHTDDGDSSGEVRRDPEEDRTTAVLNFDYKDLAIIWEGVKRDADHEKRPGSPGLLVSPGSPRQSERALKEERSWAMEGRQGLTIGKTANIEAYLSYLSNDTDSNEPLRIFEGDRVETGLDFDWTPWTSHQLLLQMSYTESDIDKAYDQGPPDEAPFELSNINRKNYSFGLQDQIRFSDHFSLTMGIRYDDYDDVGDIWTPRIAGVYRLGEPHVFKAQYSQGFRTPTFWELYRRQNLGGVDFEVIDTTEIAYIYRRPKIVGRISLYYSEVESGFLGPGGSELDPSEILESKGVELEWEQQLLEQLRWQATLSYNDTADTRWSLTHRQTDSPGLADWLGNLCIFWQFLPKYMLTGRLQHVGDRYSPDGSIDGYDKVDLTLSRRDLIKKGITLRAGVSNLFDDEIIYTTQRVQGLTLDEFQGRTVWLQLSYNF